LYVAPDLTEDAPNGFGGRLAVENLRIYLSLPTTIYVGDQDTKKKYLVTSEAAERQGKNRLKRARNIFSAARNIAKRNGWHFKWRYLEAKNVGHSSRKMLGARVALTALGLSQKAF
jgi:hypothetical protein